MSTTQSTSLEELTQRLSSYQMELSRVQNQITTLTTAATRSEETMSATLKKLDEVFSKLQDLTIEITKVLGIHDTRLAKQEVLTDAQARSILDYFRTAEELHQRLEGQIQDISSQYNVAIGRELTTLNTRADICRAQFNEYFEDLRANHQKHERKLDLLDERLDGMDRFKTKITTLMAAGVGIISLSYGVMRIIQYLVDAAHASK